MSKTCKSILVVDDNESDCLLARFSIEDSGVTDQVIFAKNGEEALRLLSDFDGSKSKYGDCFPPALILLDINMPRMNGFEFLDAYEEEYKDERLDSIVILMLTSSNSAIDKKRAQKYSSVKGFMTKPISDDCVIDAVENILS